MKELEFADRAEFRKWLSENALATEGIWILFHKKRSVSCLKAGEALEEALCFGWIDGQMQSIDENTYIKYFKQRADDSSWSEKNKKLTEKLEAVGLMTDYGRVKIDYAKDHGQWDVVKKEELTDDQLHMFQQMIKPHSESYANFVKMPPSMRKTYAKSYYFGAKTDAGREKRLQTIIERLELNLNPMQSMKK